MSSKKRRADHGTGAKGAPRVLEKRSLKKTVVQETYRASPVGAGGWRDPGRMPQKEKEKRNRLRV